MGILGIRNRTENWKTVEHFHCLGDDAKIRIAQKLGEPEDTPPEKIKIDSLVTRAFRDGSAA